MLKIVVCLGNPGEYRLWRSLVAERNCETVETIFVQNSYGVMLLNPNTGA